MRIASSLFYLHPPNICFLSSAFHPTGNHQRHAWARLLWPVARFTIPTRWTRSADLILLALQTLAL